MNRCGDTTRKPRGLLLIVAGLAVATLPTAFVVADPTSGWSQLQTQSTVQGRNPTVPAYEFEAATIKPTPPSASSASGGVSEYIGEGIFRARDWSLKALIRTAYGVPIGMDSMVSGWPKWLDSDRYDILAKAESSVADKLKKLTPDQRMQAQQEMLQSLLAERLKLVIHRETREYPVYFLTIAKNGPKLKEAKSGDPYENAFPYADKFADHAAPGVIFLVSGRPTPMTQTIYAFGVSIPRLAWNLTFWSQRIVQDRTGLRGSYDLTLTFCRNSPSGSSAAALDVQTMPSASDPCGAPTLLAAVQQQLGLRMDSGKGPVEIIVIDHVERPSQN